MTELLPSAQSSSQNENFVNTSKKQFKNRNWTFPLVRYFRLTLKFFSYILARIVDVPPPTYQHPGKPDSQAFSNFWFSTYTVVSNISYTMCHLKIQISKLALQYTRFRSQHAIMLSHRYLPYVVQLAHWTLVWSGELWDKTRKQQVYLVTLLPTTTSYELKKGVIIDV